MGHSLQRRQPILRVFAGWFALLLYLGALSPAGAALTFLVAAASPEHELQINCSESGVALVLHHQGNGAAHHHGRAARWLTLLASSSNSTDPDHVIHFVSPATATREVRLDCAETTGKDAVTPIACAGFTTDCFHVALRATTPRPPAGPGGQMLCLRTTVLMV